MYGIGRVEQLNSIKRWNDAQIVNTLAAPIGVDVNGNILSLWIELYLLVFSL